MAYTVPDDGPRSVLADLVLYDLWLSDPEVSDRPMLLREVLLEELLCCSPINCRCFEISNELRRLSAWPLKCSENAQNALHIANYILLYLSISIALLSAWAIQKCSRPQHWYYVEDKTPRCCGQLQVKDLPKVLTWRLEWDSNLQPSGRKAPNPTTELSCPTSWTPNCFTCLLICQHQYQINRVSQQ